MKKELANLLARAEVDQIDASQRAISRLLKLVAEAKHDAVDSTDDAQAALFTLLGSSRLAVVSLTCQGLTQLLESQDNTADSRVHLLEVSDELVKALEVAMTREEQQRQKQNGIARHNQEQGVTQCLTRCLVATSRVRARQEAPRQPTGGRQGGKPGEVGLGMMATLLSMNRGLLYPALSHETTCFLGRLNACQREVVGVVGPLASALLLQPQYANLRGGFLLKLSTALATSSDAVKICLIIFQAELLGFSALHTAAHADLAAGWCRSLVNTALSLDNDATWGRASCAISGVAIFLLSEFRERGAPITPLLGPLQSMAAADPLCLAGEVAFLGITALQSHCIHEREMLLDIVGRTLGAIPLRETHGSETNQGNVDLRIRTWSLETLVYPSVSMAAAGNTTAAELLPLLEAALEDVYSRAESDNVGDTTTDDDDGSSVGSKSLRFSSAVALGIRRLGRLEGDTQAVIVACKGLERRAGDFQRTNGSAVERDSSDEADLECGLCLLAPLLLRPHQQAHSAACAALVAVVRAVSTLGARLLPFVLYAIRKRGGVALESWGITSLLHLLPELGAHKLAAKPVAGVIQALAQAPQSAVRGLGLRLAADLVRVNSRTFEQLQPLLSETPADHIPPQPPEPDESRLCRAAGLLQICETEPELGLECVRPLQAFLGDSSGAVTAIALKAIAALCRGDCLEFSTALRIVTKKGKVAHTGRDSSVGFGDPRVMEGMAQLCGAGAEAVALAAAEVEETDSDDSGDGRGTRWGMANALRILLEHNLGSHPNETVRAAVYTALGSHLPALLRAATGKEAEEDAVAVASQVREFLGQAMSTDTSLAARVSLESAAIIVLTEESVDPCTWVSSKGTGASRGRGGKGGETPGPSNRLLAALPAPESVLQAFRQDDSSCPGSAGAVLWCYPVAGVTAAVAYRDTMVRDLGELMTVEETGGGLGLCPWQRASTPVGIQRYVTRLFAACLSAEQAEASSGTNVTAAAVENCRGAIANLRGVQGGLVAVASASLACCLPASFSHVALEETSRAVDRLRSCSGGAQPLLDGEEMFPLCTAMAVRALPDSSARKVEQTCEEIERFHSTASDASMPNEAYSFWSCVAVGVASEWSLRHPTSPGASKMVLRAVRCLLVGLAHAIGSDHVFAIADTWCRDSVDGDARPDRAAVVEWDVVDVGQAGTGEDSGIGLPTTTRGSNCFALFLGLSSTLPGLRATGLHLELLQVFNIVRALALKPVAGLCGATLCLAAAASECLSCALVDGPVMLSCLRSVSLDLDLDPSSNKDGRGKTPAQDACLGAAGLVTACEGKVVLPPGFAESMFERLRKAAAHRRGANSGVRVASLWALASLVGCPLLVPGELVPRRMRVTSITNRRMVETLLQDVREAMEGTSIRPKNAAARVWGCMCALGQDERSVGDPSLQKALGWTEGGEASGAFHGGGGGATTSVINPGALCVAREGTLMNVVLTGLQSIAAGVQDARDGMAEKTNKKSFVPVHSSLFAGSAIACLEPCPTLRVPHPQMAVVIEALFRGGHGAEVQMRCVSLALALVGKEQAYSTWLHGLFQKPLFMNLPGDLRRHLVSVVDQLFFKLPLERGTHLIMELWSTITASLFSSCSTASGSGRHGEVEHGSEGIKQATTFLSGVDKLAAAAAAAATTSTFSAIESITLTKIYPSILEDFCSVGDVMRFHSDADEAALWDVLVGLLSRFPWKNVQGTITSETLAVITNATTSADLCGQTFQQYFTSRLAPTGEARNASEGEAMSQAAPPPAAAVTATATAKVLGSVARWVIRTRTSDEASAAVLPRLSEGAQDIAATAAGGKWLLTLLDTAELPESCPMRAAALVGGATAVKECSNTGLVIVGENADELWAPRGSNHRSSALIYSMTVTAPRVVARMDKAKAAASPDLSSEVLGRLFRLSTLLTGRIGGAVEAADERGVAELEEVQCGVEGFVRGLRHTPAVLLGTLSRSFTCYAESVATDCALSS